MKNIYFLMLCCVFALGCGEDSSGGNNGGNNGGGGGGASSSEIDECRRSCNQLKFFSCNDAQDHATCFQNCDAASSSKIDLFTACVDADICDAQCSVNLKPATPVTPPKTDTCVSLCETFVSESCIPNATAAECTPACAQEGALVTYCLANRNACTLPEGCTLAPPTPAEACKEGCAQLGFFSCISPVETGECSAKCDTADAATAEQFTTCAQTGICSDNSCYRVLDPTIGASTDVAGCQSTCDNLQFFDCIDAAGLSSCRTLCETATGESIETFKSCGTGLCDDDACYTQLQAANP